MLIRPRTEADVAPCEALARRVQTLDGYPVYLPDDLAAFVYVAHPTVMDEAPRVL